MSKCLIIPDIHLKPWILQGAEDILHKDSSIDMAVCLGDIVDDWGREYQLDIYEGTLITVLEFMTKHNNTLLCYGNHDVSYMWGKEETGYSFAARQLVLKYMDKIKNVCGSRLRFVHKVESVIFSHAGLTLNYVDEFCEDIRDDMDAVLNRINNDFGVEELWKYTSPIWARPQPGYSKYEMFAPGYLHVVGHTPVEKSLLSGDVLSVDTFSTLRDGTPIGDRRFIWVDTVSKEWGYE